ncbi:MAG: hypothetical protein ACE5EF_07105 [Dehalococcoidia bacterium]
MGILDIFRRAPAKEAEEEASPCPHTALAPGWDDAADIGKEDRATSWTCSSCGTAFTPEEYETLRKTEAERLKGVLKT